MPIRMKRIRSSGMNCNSTLQLWRTARQLPIDYTCARGSTAASLAKTLEWSKQAGYLKEVPSAAKLFDLSFFAPKPMKTTQNLKRISEGTLMRCWSFFVIWHFASTTGLFGRISPEYSLLLLPPPTVVFKALGANGLVRILVGRGVRSAWCAS